MKGGVDHGPNQNRKVHIRIEKDVYKRQPYYIVNEKTEEFVFGDFLLLFLNGYGITKHSYPVISDGMESRLEMYIKAVSYTHLQAGAPETVDMVMNILDEEHQRWEARRKRIMLLEGRESNKSI